MIFPLSWTLKCGLHQQKHGKTLGSQEWHPLDWQLNICNRNGGRRCRHSCTGARVSIWVLGDYCLTVWSFPGKTTNVFANFGPACLLSSLSPLHVQIAWSTHTAGAQKLSGCQGPSPPCSWLLSESRWRMALKTAPKYQLSLEQTQQCVHTHTHTYACTLWKLF